MDKKSILNHIKTLTFSSDLSGIFSILEKNLDKVEFTKDYVGLRDFVYLSEKDAGENEYPFYGFFDFTEKSSFEDVGVYNEVVYEINEMAKQLERFFKVCNRPIYVSISFKDSTLTSEDKLYIHTMIEKKEIKDKHEGEYKLRKFPEWYDAKYPSEILEDVELTEVIELLRLKEDALTEDLKLLVLEEINDALDNDDQKLFEELTSRYIKMAK